MAPFSEKEFEHVSVCCSAYGKGTTKQNQTHCFIRGIWNLYAGPMNNNFKKSWVFHSKIWHQPCELLVLPLWKGWQMSVRQAEQQSWCAVSLSNAQRVSTDKNTNNNLVVSKEPCCSLSLSCCYSCAGEILTQISPQSRKPMWKCIKIMFTAFSLCGGATLHFASDLSSKTCV